MTEPQDITVEEITTKCLVPLGAALIENLALERRVESQTDLIRQLKTNEAGLIGRIEDLESDLAEIKIAAKLTLSPELAELAAQGSETIKGSK